MPEPARKPEPPSWPQTAFDQKGTLARAQALAEGLTKSAWDWRLDRGLWRSVCPGVAVTHSGEATLEQTRWAAVLHAGRGAAISGDAGLVVEGTKRINNATIDVAVPRDRHIDDVTVDGTKVTVHRVARLEQWTNQRRGLPVTERHVAALHAAAWAPSDEIAERRIASAVQQRVCAVVVFRKTLLLMPKLNRRALLLEVLDDVELGAHANSELDFLRFCRRNGLPEPDELQVKVRTTGLRYVDARYRKQRVSFEVDGGYHMEEAQWNADSMRTLELAVSFSGTGEQQIRLTRFNLRHREAQTAALLRTLLL